MQADFVTVAYPFIRVALRGHDEGPGAAAGTCEALLTRAYDASPVEQTWVQNGRVPNVSEGVRYLLACFVNSLSCDWSDAERAHATALLEKIVVLAHPRRDELVNAWGHEFWRIAAEDGNGRPDLSELAQLLVYLGFQEPLTETDQQHRATLLSRPVVAPQCEVTFPAAPAPTPRPHRAWRAAGRWVCWVVAAAWVSASVAVTLSVLRPFLRW